MLIRGVIVSIYLSIYLSPDPVFGNGNGNGNDILVLDRNHANPLTPDAGYSNASSFTIPTNLLGDFYIVVKTDWWGHVLEENEFNNVLISDETFEVTPFDPAAIPPKPDVAASNVNAPTDVTSGQSIPVSWTVTNHDAPTGNRGFYDTVYLSRDQVFDASFDTAIGTFLRPTGLGNGASYNQQANVTIPRGLSGQYYVFVKTDSSNGIIESNEANNAAFDAGPITITLAPPADLVPDEDVTIPVNAVPGQNMTLTYTVYNQGDNPAEGQWFDSLYISADETWDIDDPLFARVLHRGNVAGGSAYTETVTAPLPGVVPGDYHVIIRSDIRNHIPESSEANNIEASVDRVDIDFQLLDLGTPFAGELGEGRSAFFRVDVEAGETLIVNLDSQLPLATNEMYIRYGDVPSRSQFDFAHSSPLTADQRILIPTTRGGTYFITVFAPNVPGDQPQDYTITADTLQFSLIDINTNEVSNRGQSTLTLTGSKFTPNTKAIVVDPDGDQVEASKIYWVDESTIWATFDMTGQDLGLYDIQVVEGAMVSELTDLLDVTDDVVGDWQLRLVMPAAIRPGQVAVASIQYANAGFTDLPASVLQLSAINAILRLPEETEFEGTTRQLLAINDQGPAGILQVGLNDALAVLFLPTVTVGFVEITATSLQPSDAPLDLTFLKEDLRPDFVNTQAWDRIFEGIDDNFGATFADYLDVITENATHLSQMGRYVTDPNDLFTFEVTKAAQIFDVFNTEQAMDALAPSPGFGMSFSRLFETSLLGRYTIGAMGRGWTNQWEIKAMTDSDGNVNILGPGTIRLFTPNGDGTFTGGTGELASLVETPLGLQLTETSGVIFAFNPTGLLTSTTDLNSNKVTLSYTGTQLTQITHSSGMAFNLTYDTNGRLETLTDHDSRVTTYTYDPTGQYLLNVIGPAGESTYTYDMVEGSSSRHALLTATTNGVMRTFEYDSRGRIAASFYGVNEERMQYTYDTGGATVYITDAQGTETLLFNEFGQIGHAYDALGRGTRFTYDPNLNTTGQVLPGGLTYGYTYDSLGRLTSSLSPVGEVRLLDREITNGTILTATDSNGNALTYEIDVNGNLIKLFHEDNTFIQFTYDNDGNPTSLTDRRGNTNASIYDAKGLLQQINYDDGSTALFEYDSRGNMTKMTDPTSITQWQYDTSDRLLRVDYPGSRFLELTYDANSRRETVTDETGFVTQYEYDAVGRLHRLRDTDDALLVQYTYDALGRVSRRDLGNGTATTYEYDAADQLLKLTNLAPGGATNSSFEYEYDAIGRMRSMTTDEGLWSYQYDALGQLVLVNTPDGNEIEYQYDAAGNRTAEIVNGSATNYLLDNLNRINTAGSAVYTYDADGNLTNTTDGGQVTTYDYDVQGQLIQSTVNGVVTQYEYDSLGNRIATTDAGVQTQYVYDPTGLTNLVGSYVNAGNQSAKYLHGLGLFGQIDAIGDFYFYDFDAAGNVIGLTDDAGNYVNTYSYQAFGQLRSSTETIANPFTFVGEQGVQRDSSGLYYMRNRYYDSTDGRFTALDPLLIAPTQNSPFEPYGYALNNPLQLKDPLGLNTRGFFSGIRNRTQSLNDAIDNPNNNDAYNRYNDANQQIADNARGFAEDLNGAVPKTPPKSPTALFKPFKLFYDALCGAGLIGGFGGECQNDDTGRTTVARPNDPNDIVGPDGFGEERYVSGNEILPFMIRFENQASATAPAQQVFITQTLDEDLDSRTFRFGDFGWGEFFFDVPDNAAFINERFSFTSDEGDFLVDVIGFVDPNIGLATWILSTVDPTTGERPDNPLIGFLPPNDENAIGEGFVTYTVRNRLSAQTGDVVDSLATIIFDEEAPIDTPAIFNTMDTVAPDSTVNALPAVQAAATFEVSWAATEDEGGSGVLDYTIYVSTNGGEFELWLENTTLTSAPFEGEAGNDYAFYSVARDNAGNVEQVPQAPDATTNVPTTDPPQVTDVVIGDGSGQASMITSLQIAFTKPVNLTPDAITLQLDAGGPLVELDVQTTDNGQTYLVTFTGTNVIGGSLADGLYTLTIHGDQVTDGTGQAMAQDYQAQFYRLFADVDGNEAVDVADFAALRRAINTKTGDFHFKPEQDWNSDGIINVLDVSEFRSRLWMTRDDLVVTVIDPMILVNHGQAQRSNVNVIDVEFDMPINGFNLGAFELRRVKLADGSVDNTLIDLLVIQNENLFTLTFQGNEVTPGGSLSDGLYELTIHRSMILDGNDAPLAGGDVDLTDYYAIRGALNTTSQDPEFDSAFDGDDDDDVDIFDLIMLRMQLGSAIEL